MNDWTLLRKRTNQLYDALEDEDEHRAAERLRELTAELRTPPAENGSGPAELEGGYSHAEILRLELPEDRHLVTDLVPSGSVGTIAGLPETHKSFLAQSIAVRVAGGEGAILGHDVARAANVAYVWQDDSTRSEIERIKLYQTVHDTTREDIPLRWYLNLGVALPEDIDRLRATVDEYSTELVILDSFYNFLGVGLRDHEAEQLVSLLKQRISDPTGATVLIVDHMPWPTEANKGRLRSYGGVFKNAVTRFGIYLHAEGKKLYVEARGNNIKGFSRTPARWNGDHLEIELIAPTVAAEDVDDLVLEERIIAYLTDNPDAEGKEFDQIEGKTRAVYEARKNLLADGRITKVKDGKRYLWNIAEPGLFELPTSPAEGSTGSTWEVDSSNPLNEAERRTSRTEEVRGSTYGNEESDSDVLPERTSSLLRREGSIEKVRSRSTAREFDPTGSEEEVADDYRGDDDIPF